MKLCSFGHWLENEIERVGTNWSGLAQLLGVHHASVNHWKTGQTQPSAKNITKLAQVLRVPVEEIYEALGRIAPSREWSPRIRRIARMLEALPNEDLSFAEELVSRLEERAARRVLQADNLVGDAKSD